MTISYQWLNDYLPVQIDPDKLSNILTSIGLEVETLHFYEEIPGSLTGLVTGEVLECWQHPQADKLKLTKVTIGPGEPLQIVCGAPNVAAGQKVVVATIGATIHPLKGESITLKAAKIRGEESRGMLCAEDEIGLGESHAGIIVLPPDTPIGLSVADVYKPYTDWIYEIGLTPNRTDAMSHLGVARDVCAYLTHHERKTHAVKSPFVQAFTVENQDLPIKVRLEDTACRRFSGVSLTGIGIGPSPVWMQQRLKAIGVRPINNIVDITNYVLHETGQPLHAYDATKIAGHTLIVKTLPEGTPFTALDGKERTLSAEDLVVADTQHALGLGGVFGGLDSGISQQTTSLILESAWFEPVRIRKTSLRHGLRTDAAVRFEKGVDISGTMQVLKRAARLIKEIAGGQISSDLIDVYPTPVSQPIVSLKFQYLKKLSGKNYHPDVVKNILEALGFTLQRETIDEVTVAVPFSKTDIHLPADLVEEVMRIDGLDNIDIPSAIRLSPMVEADQTTAAVKEKVASYLVGLGFNEILTNSISNSAFFDAYADKHPIRLLNNLSTELDMLRPSMLETGLEVVAYNLNRQRLSLRFFEFGKTYGHRSGEMTGPTPYLEEDHLCLYLTGSGGQDNWYQKGKPLDLYYAKGIAGTLLTLCGIDSLRQEIHSSPELPEEVRFLHQGTVLARVGQVAGKISGGFDIRQNVFFVDIDWQHVARLYAAQNILYREVGRFPSVQRDLALVVDEGLSYARIEATAEQVKLEKLKSIALFDLFRSDKIGAHKKSVALSFTFQDETKTLTDKEIDGMMQKLMRAFESELGADIRK